MVEKDGIRLNARNLVCVASESGADECLLCGDEFLVEETRLCVSVAYNRADGLTICLTCAGKGVMALLSRRRKGYLFPAEEQMSSAEIAEAEERHNAVIGVIGRRPTEREYRQQQQAEYAALLEEVR